MFAGYTPVAVEDFGESNGGQPLIMLHDDGFVVNWQLGTNWERRSNNPTVDASDASGLAAIEASFGVDVTPLPPLTAIEEAGNTTLNKDGDGNLYAGEAPLYFGSTQITINMFAGYTPVAVEDFGESNGGRQLVMLHDNGFVVIGNSALIGNDVQATQLWMHQMRVALQRSKPASVLMLRHCHHLQPLKRLGIRQQRWRRQSLCR